MASYDIQGVDNELDKKKKKVIDVAENVQLTADDPMRNEQDLYADILEFQSIFTKKELGNRVMLAAVKNNFTVDDSILQEMK